MPRYLVVANLTLGGAHLMEEIEKRAQDPEARFHVFVPANAKQDGFHLVDEEEATIAANRRLKEAIQRIAALKPKEVTGELGSARPLDAIGDAVRHAVNDPFDEIILSTLPSGPSRWLSMDLPARVARQHDIPLTHVEAPAAQ